jgi:FkbM family methyltransferase
MKITDFGVAVIEGDTHVSKWVEEARTLEIAAKWPIALYKHLIPVGGVVLDVGACIGDHTATYSKLVGPEGRVHAFEINPNAYECLKHNMRTEPNVWTHMVGLGNKREKVKFLISPNAGASAIDSENGNVECLVFPLDEEFPIDARVDFIKIDAEGYEYFILDGARKTIAKHKPSMFVEINRGALAKFGFTPNDVLALIDQMGYHFSPVPYGTVIQTSPQFDVICTVK